MLPKLISQEPKDSDAFYDGLWESAQQFDCLNTMDALDISFGERFFSFPPSYLYLILCTDFAHFPFFLFPFFSLFPRYIADTVLFCKGEGLLYSDYGQMESDEALINSICPMRVCLGERTCRFEMAKVFFFFFFFFFFFHFLFSLCWMCV